MVTDYASISVLPVGTVTKTASCLCADSYVSDVDARQQLNVVNGSTVVPSAKYVICL